MKTEYYIAGVKQTPTVRLLGRIAIYYAVGLRLSREDNSSYARIQFEITRDLLRDYLPKFNRSVRIQVGHEIRLTLRRKPNDLRASVAVCGV